MRDIKFRAWDGDYMWSHLELEDLPLSSVLRAPRNNDWKLMQFTGLFDKNGKEIF